MLHVGQMVECVDAGKRPQIIRTNGGWESPIKKGAVYTIRWVGIDPHDGCACVKLVEVIRDRGDRGFYPDRFRPLQDSKLEVFRALLVDLPALPKFEPTKERV